MYIIVSSAKNYVIALIGLIVSMITQKITN